MSIPSRVWTVIYYRRSEVWFAGLPILGLHSAVVNIKYIFCQKLVILLVLKVTTLLVVSRDLTNESERRMNPHDELLRILMTVERCLSFTNAVELHLRQPWVAQQIKLLEKDYGLKLCKINGCRMIELTEAGRLLVKYANRKE